MDVSKIHSNSSNDKLFTEKVSPRAIVDKKIISQNVSNNTSVSNTHPLTNKDNDSDDDVATSKKEISTDQPASFALYAIPSPPASSGISPIGTRVEFAIERELNLVVTTVRDLDTEKIIRQFPPEETISRMKMLKSYYNQIAQANLGNKVDEVVK